MKINMTRRVATAVFAAAIAFPVSLVAAGNASADPVGPPTPRVLNGMGSDTTDELMQAISESVQVGGTKVLGNWNAIGGVADTNGSDAGCTYAANNTSTPPGANGAGIRANGSSAGRDRLNEASTAGNAFEGCLQWARSSSGGVVAGQTALRLAGDALSYAIRGTSSLSKQLSRAALVTQYSRNAPCSTTIFPKIPQTGSGSRASWLTYLGLTEATLGNCVLPVQENAGNVLTGNGDLMPYSCSQYSAQSIGVVADLRGTAVLGGIGGVPCLVSNLASASTRNVFNLVPTAAISGPSADPTLVAAFSGPNSQVCLQDTNISKFGFATIGANCGS